MSKTFKVNASGVCGTTGLRLFWTVAAYADKDLALLHVVHCQNFLFTLLNGLPKYLHDDRASLWKTISNPMDPQCAMLEAIDVVYNLEEATLSTEVPKWAAPKWAALDTEHQAVRYLLQQVVRKFLFEEFVEGAPEGPLPDIVYAVERLRQIGIDPELPAIGGLPGETGGQAYYRIYGEMVAYERAAHQAKNSVPFVS